MTAASANSRSNASKAPRAVRIAARLTELALVAVLAVLLARAVWFLLYGAAAEPLDLSLGDPARVEAPIERADLSALARSGVFAARQGGEAVVETVVPETQLNITLRGVRRGADPQSGAAILQAPNQGQRTLPVGGEIAEGVTLEAVYEDYVIINRRGARESVYLREPSARRRGATLQPAATAAAPSSAPALSGRPNPELARELDAEDWQDGLRLAPEFAAGAMIGFRVRENTRLEVLQASGLLRGDIITSLNGVSLTSADGAAEAIRQFETADRVSFTVLRDGEAVTLEAPLR